MARKLRRHREARTAMAREPRRHREARRAVAIQKNAWIASGGTLAMTIVAVFQ